MAIDRGRKLGPSPTDRYESHRPVSGLYDGRDTKRLERRSAMLSEMLQSDDWKNEKHVPVIEVGEGAAPDEVFEVRVTLGKEVAHPNTTAHHIRWISLYFKPEGSAQPFEVGKAMFAAHGASTEGPDKSTVYTHHGCTFRMKTGRPGTLMAMAYCNIHGLWQSSAELSL